jgi:hypothetical protein
VVAILTVAFVATLTLGARAATDLGGGGCVDEGAGIAGMWNGTTADDAGCITPAEYSERFAPSALVAAGVIDSYADNGDGTSTLHFGDGIATSVRTEPLERKVSANEALEPEAPTVSEWFYRITHAITGGGPQA